MNLRAVFFDDADRPWVADPRPLDLPQAPRRVQGHFRAL